MAGISLIVELRALECMNSYPYCRRVTHLVVYDRSTKLAGDTLYKGKSEQVCRLHYDKVGKLANLMVM
jgi:hypothetical protein